MLKRIYIHNYKCLVNFELPLQETVLLLGRNGVGKTAVLDAMFGIRGLLDGRARIADSYVFPQSTLTRWQTLPRQVLEIDAEFGGHSFTYRLEIEHDKDNKLSRVSHEALVGDGITLFRFKMGEVQLYRDDGSIGPSYGADWTESALARVHTHRKDNTKLTAFMESMQKLIICAINPFQMDAESKKEAKALHRYAENFVSWYRYAVQENPTAAHPHVESLRDVMPGFDKFFLPHSGLGSRALLSEFHPEGRNQKQHQLGFDELSEGQRTLVVLYALLHLSEPNTLLFIDEPDNFVTLPEIQPWIRQVADLSDVVSQAVICSHHPEFIDYLGRDCGVMLRRDSTLVTKTQALASLSDGNGLRLSELVARGWAG